MLLSSFDFKTSLLRLHMFVYRMFGIMLCEIERTAEGKIQVVFSMQGFLMSIFWSSLICYCYSFVDLEATTGLIAIYRSPIADVGNAFQGILNFAFIPAIFIPSWLCYKKRKLVMQWNIRVEEKFGTLSVKAEENWALYQHLGQVIILMICYGIYIASSTYLLSRFQAANKTSSQGHDIRLAISTYSSFLFGFLCVIDLVSSLSFVVRRMTIVHRVLVNIQENKYK